MKNIKTFEAYLLECGKGDAGYQKKEKCPECGKKMKKCKCAEGKVAESKVEAEPTKE